MTNYFTQLCHGFRLSKEEETAEKEWEWLQDAFNFYEVLESHGVTDMLVEQWQTFGDVLAERRDYFKGALTPAEAGELLALAKEYEVAHGVRLKRTDEGVILFTDESAAVEPVALILQMFLKRFARDVYMKLSWANTVSRAVPGGFSGGYCVVTAEKVFWLTEIAWQTPELKKVLG